MVKLKAKEYCNILNCYVSHGSCSTAKFLKICEKWSMYFVDNLLLFPIVKKK